MSAIVNTANRGESIRRHLVFSNFSFSFYSNDINHKNVINNLKLKWRLSIWRTDGIKIATDIGYPLKNNEINENENENNNINNNNSNSYYCPKSFVVSLNECELLQILI